jgi:hypothetical protein
MTVDLGDVTLFYHTLAFLTELRMGDYIHISDDELVGILDEYPADVASPIYRILGTK